MKRIFLISVLALIAVLAFAAAPVVRDVTATPSAGKVTISYDLTADGACKITVVVSANGGTNYNIYPTALSGTGYGDEVTTGTDKEIIWRPGNETPPMVVGTNYKVKVIARDNLGATTTDDFILVAGGTFSRQNSNGSYPDPPVMVTLSTFFIDKYEVTQNEYLAVMGSNPSYFPNNPNRPVELVSWFNAIEYCNRRSMQERLTPCYTYNDGTDYGTNPDTWPSGWNTSNGNHTNVSCNWTATGYRLPTEMEWMFAAKGGNQSEGNTYSGSNTIGNVAWYYTNAGSGLPDGSSDPDYGTHNVGTKAANELGTFDMSGNVGEWCWDINGNYPSGDQTNPTGPVSGSFRVRRGGGWSNYAGGCTVSIRSYYNATGTSDNLGFRLCRVSP